MIMKTETLYRFLDKENRLLYVGISSDWVSRLNQHYKKADWFHEVATSTFTHYKTRHEVEAAERTAIAKEGPIHNRALNPHHETPVGHLAKLKAWTYLDIESDSQHKRMVEHLRDLFVDDNLWVSKTAGPIAYYLQENFSFWAEWYGLDCQGCLDAVNSPQIISWARSVKRARNANN